MSIASLSGLSIGTEDTNVAEAELPTTDQIEDIDTGVSDGLEGYSELFALKEALGGTISPRAASIARISLESIKARLGVKEQTLTSALESVAIGYGTPTTLNIAVEGLAEFLGKVWEGIKRAISAMFDAIASFIARIKEVFSGASSGAIHTLDDCMARVKAVNDGVGTEAVNDGGKTVSIPGIQKRFFTQHDNDVIANDLLDSAKKAEILGETKEFHSFFTSATKIQTEICDLMWSIKRHDLAKEFDTVESVDEFLDKSSGALREIIYSPHTSWGMEEDVVKTPFMGNTSVSFTYLNDNQELPFNGYFYSEEGDFEQQKFILPSRQQLEELMVGFKPLLSKKLRLVTILEDSVKRRHDSFGKYSKDVDDLLKKYSEDLGKMRLPVANANYYMGQISKNATKLQTQYVSKVAELHEAIMKYIVFMTKAVVHPF